MVRVRSPQDFWAGILFIVFGGAALWISRGYAFGSLTKMGPGYLPTALSWALVAVGGVLMLRALAIDGPAIERSLVAPQLFILAAIVVFALVIERLGLALAVVLVAVTSSLASRDMRWGETLALAVGIAALCVLLFVHLLGQPFTVLAF
jgi:putative tricarboxylic transport membrane protein